MKEFSPSSAQNAVAACRCGRIATLVATALLASCALVEPPTAQIAVTRAAIAEAERAGAADRAPAELAAAREKLAAAEMRTRRGHYDEAQILAEQAETDARLAAVMARAAALEPTRTSGSSP
jgi:hypothetical protein